ncbi:hypothetical protein AAMO2058_000848600 [Amorphochlora amoebiformis]
MQPSSLVVGTSAALVAGYVIACRISASCWPQERSSTTLGPSRGSSKAGELRKRIAESESALFLEALEVTASALRLYGPQSVWVSFNGGKDATTVFHLVRAALNEYNGFHNTRHKMHAVYFHNDKKAIEGTREFVEQTCRTHDVDLVVLRCGYKEGIQDLVSNRGAKAFVIGTRSNDPNGRNSGHFHPSSKTWPVFMRVNPVIHWDYGTVWEFLREMKIPYFHLYDQGYTSLGDRNCSFRNPLLKKPDGSYSPAYTLTNFASERSDRSTEDASSQKPHAHCSVSNSSPSASHPTGGVRGESKGENGSLRASLGLLIVSEDVLGGDGVFRDEWRALRLGLEFDEVVTVGSWDMKRAVEHVRRLSKSFDYVIISAGRGERGLEAVAPAVAEAFKRTIKRNEQLSALHKKFGDSHTIPEVSSHIPKSTRLTFIKGLQYPAIIYRNVYLMPGVRSAYFKSALRAIATTLDAAAGLKM